MDFTKGIEHFPQHPGKALHTHALMCQFRMAQAEKKNLFKDMKITYNRNNKNWFHVFILHKYKHVMLVSLAKASNSKSYYVSMLKLFFPLLLPDASYFFPQPGALHNYVMECESYCTTRAYSTGSSMQCDMACIRSGLHRKK